jgi:hypothetical protein
MSSFLLVMKSFFHKDNDAKVDIIDYGRNIKPEGLALSY